MWFPTKTQVKFVGDITVKHVSEAKGSHVTITKLVLQSKVLFLHFSLTDWCLTVLYLLNSKEMFMQKYNKSLARHFHHAIDKNI